MPDTPSITIVKSFSYRNQAEEFSNTYHFEGTTPVDAAAWKVLADAIIAAERPTVGAGVTWVRAYGYVAGNENSVAQIDYTVAPNVVLGGTGGYVESQQAPGDAAATIRWFTGATSSRGKKVYCRKYMHGVCFDATDQDLVKTTQKAAWETFADKMIDGTLPGSFKYCGPQGADLSNPEVLQWITTRTLKRRGKRPPLAVGP